MRGADLGQLGKDGEFKGWNLRDGFDDEVDVVEILEFRRPS